MFKKNLYTITKGQFITVWIFGVILELYMLSKANGYSPSEFAGFMAIAIPFLLVFYTLGRRNYLKKNEDKS